MQSRMISFDSVLLGVIKICLPAPYFLCRLEKLQSQNRRATLRSECQEKLVENSEENYNEIMQKFQETTYKRIVEELIDDAILEVCFEVHRAAKLGYFDLEFPNTEECQSAENPGEEKNEPIVKSKNLVTEKYVNCPICKKKVAATKFANHLASCMNLKSSTTRVSSRAASQKLADSDALSNFDESDDSNFGNGKKSKKGRGKGRKTKTGSANSKLMDLNVNYREMTYEKRKEFLNQKCGVITKRANTMCAKSLKCSQHTDEERINVRRILLKDVNGQIDVDTADADSPFMMETFFTHTPQETNLL